MAVSCSQSLVKQLNVKFELNIMLEEQVLHPSLKTTRLRCNPLELEHTVADASGRHNQTCDGALCLWPSPQTSRCQSCGCEMM